MIMIILDNYLIRILFDLYQTETVKADVLLMLSNLIESKIN